MNSSGSLKGKNAQEFVWMVLATLAGFVLAGFLARSERATSTLVSRTNVEFAAKEYYDC